MRGGSAEGEGMRAGRIGCEFKRSLERSCDRLMLKNYEAVRDNQAYKPFDSTH